MRLSGLHWLGWREFRRAFVLGKAPGGRDFLLLFLALAGLLTIAALLLALRDGLVAGLAYSLLGGGPGYGLPIAVRRHLDQSGSGFEDLAALQDSFGAVTITAPATARAPVPEDPPGSDPGWKAAFRSLTLAPYWVLETGEGDPGLPVGIPLPTVGPDAAVKAPARAIWRASHPTKDEDQQMLGWALPPADPLWAWVAQHRVGTGPLPPADRLRPWAVFNLAQFRDFDYQAYRDWLAEALPAPVFAGLDLPLLGSPVPDDAGGAPPSINDAGTSPAPPKRTARYCPTPRKCLLALDHLYLTLPLGRGGRQPVRFDAIWVEGLPVTDQVAYLLPLALHHAAVAARARALDGRSIHWFPEVADGGGDRLTSLDVQPMLYRSDEAEAAAARQAMAACLKAPYAEALRDGKIAPLPRAWYQACAEATGLDRERFTVNPGTQSADPLSAPEPLVLGGVPCKLLGKQQSLSTTEPGVCNAYLLGGERAYLANVLAPDRQALVAAVDQLDQARSADQRRYFFVDPNYRNALERFRFVSSLLGWGQWPVFLGLFAFGGYVLWIVLHGLLGHRRVHYGLLLSRGVTVGMLRLILLWQVTLAVLTAALLALVLFAIAWAVVNRLFDGSAAAVLGRGLGVVGQPVLAWPGALELFGLVGLIWMQTLLLVPISLWFGGVRDDCEPIQLLK